MADLAGARIIVAGAGAVGSAIAVTLAQAGAKVIWVDSAGVGDNASGVAAGMLAPAFETALDPAGPDGFELLRDSRDRWPALARRLGGGDIGLRKSGAIWVDFANDSGLKAVDLGQLMNRFGARSERWTAAQIRGAAPGVRADVAGGLFTPDDWRIDPALALAAMRSAAIAAGAEVVDGRLNAFEGDTARVSGGLEFHADRLVLATGADETGLAPELEHVTPIKGHILHFTSQGDEGEQPMLRSRGGYAAPARGGLSVGATMEPGLRDRAVDMGQVAQLKSMAVGLYPSLASAEPIARVGVRAATPDGLPLVGASARPDVLLAVGMRRNGWLLAPLVAAMMAAYLTGENPGPHAARLGARRFGPA